MRKSVLFLILVIILADYSFAQKKRPMTFIDLIEIPTLSDPCLSPEGDQLIYTLSKADWEKNKRVRHIWRINTDGTDNIQLTNGLKGENNPRWSPDGKYIAFTAKRGEEESSQVYLIFNHGGEAIRLTNHATSVSSIQWSSDGSAIFFTAKEKKSKEEKKRKKDKDDVFPFEENYKQRHLWKISIADKKEEQITSGEYTVHSYNLSRDGKKIVFHRGDSPLRGERDKSEIWVMDTDGSKQLRLTHNSIPEQNARLSPDNSQVLFISWSNEKFEPYYNNNLFVVSAKGGGSKLLLKDIPHEMRSASWSNDGKSIYFIANMGVNSELFNLKVNSEKPDQLTAGKHSIRSWFYSPKSDKHILSISNYANGGDLWTHNSSGPKQLQRITHVYDFLNEQFELPQQEVIQWRGEDGETVEGLLIYPLNYKKGQRYPLIVRTHGGPRSSSKYGIYNPVLAAKGYVFLTPNYRGSTGYGDVFLRDMVGHYFNQAHKDVMAGVDYLIEKGIADPTKLIKAGWSAGGHMTNKIITYTNRFSAASSGAGAANWISMYAQSDTRIQRTPWFGGTPWQKNAPTKIYWDQSPLKDVWKVKTPTVFFVGQNDPRVPMPQSVEMYRALKSNGVTTKLYIAPREEHGWRELRHKLYLMNAELEWFEKYAMGREYTWEKAPEKKNKDSEE